MTHHHQKQGDTYSRPPDEVDGVTSNQVFLLPTDTVPGIAAGTTPFAIATLKSALAALDPTLSTPFTWHAHDSAEVLDALSDASPLVRRALARLWPGPVTLAIDLSERDRAAVHALLGSQSADDSHSLWVRVPDHATARAFLRKAGPIIARGVPDGRGGLCPTLVDARARLRHASIPFTEIGISPDTPSTPSSSGTAAEGSGLPSTLVRLPRTGGFKVERVGAMSAETVRRQLTLHMLFVCTGNTCRSPMAERIARYMAERRPAGAFPIEAASAGVSAMPGDPTTPEALEALRRQGIDVHSSGARQLDAAALGWADLVFTMTAAHLREARRLGAQDARLLDPAGHDVPDPIGGTQRQYDDTARRLAELIAARMQEFST